jgi:hypothetical protein
MVYVLETVMGNSVEKQPFGLTTFNGEQISDNPGLLDFTLDPYTGYKNLPGQKNGAYTINSLGLRGPEPTEKKKEKNHNRWRIGHIWILCE